MKRPHEKGKIMYQQMAHSLSTPTQNVSKRVTSHDVEVWDRLHLLQFYSPCMSLPRFWRPWMLEADGPAWIRNCLAARGFKPEVCKARVRPEKPLRSLQLSTLHLPAQPIILEQKSLVALRKVHTLAGVSYRDLVAFVEVALVKARVGYLYCLDLVPLCCMLNS